MSKEIQDLGNKIVQELPGTFALLFAGAAIYMSEADPTVREQLNNKKDQLKHWAHMYKWGKTYMPILIIAGTSSAVVTFFQTKEKFWLYGGAAFFSIIPYTFAVMMKTNNELNATLEKTVEDEIEEGQKATVTEKLKKWVKMHRGRALIALGSSALFFVAKQYSKK